LQRQDKWRKKLGSFCSKIRRNGQIPKSSFEIFNGQLSEQVQGFQGYIEMG
jgi:hypothetical protein